MEKKNGSVSKAEVEEWHPVETCLDSQTRVRSPGEGWGLHLWLGVDLASLWSPLCVGLWFSCPSLFYLLIGVLIAILLTRDL